MWMDDSVRRRSSRPRGGFFVPGTDRSIVAHLKQCDATVHNLFLHGAQLSVWEQIVVAVAAGFREPSVWTGQGRLKGWETR